MPEVERFRGGLQAVHARDIRGRGRLERGLLQGRVNVWIGSIFPVEWLLWAYGTHPIEPHPHDLVTQSWNLLVETDP